MYFNPKTLITQLQDVVTYIGAKKYFFRVAGFYQKKFRLGFFSNEACSAPLRGTSLAFDAFVNGLFKVVALNESCP